MVVEELLVESEGVLEGAHQLRCEVGVVGVVKDQAQIVSLDLAQLRPRRGCYKNETGERDKPPACERRGNRRPPESCQRDDLADAREFLLKAHIGSGLDRALQLRRRRLETRVAYEGPEVRVANKGHEVPVADERHEARIRSQAGKLRIREHLRDLCLHARIYSRVHAGSDVRQPQVRDRVHKLRVAQQAHKLRVTQQIREI